MSGKVCFLLSTLFCVYTSTFTQNLVVNPGAELSPSGTGWTIVSSGANACAGLPTSTYSNWTMTPDNSATYPAAHGGTKTFFAGCNVTTPAGPFELYQDIDVSADAIPIDAGSVSYIFSGYIQTPVSGQADAGKMTVDFLDGSNAVLGTSYSTGYQSNSGGSGSGWLSYINTRAASVGTRKIRIHLFTTIATGPAINASFDDISLTKTVTLPIALLSFSGQEHSDNIALEWSVSNAVNFSSFEIEKSTDGSNFVQAGIIEYTNLETTYNFDDKKNADQPRVFYRLKMIDISGHFFYSQILAFNTNVSPAFGISPNPASGNIVITGLHNKGIILIRDMLGNTMLQYQANAATMVVNISRLTRGVYAVSYIDGNSIATKELNVQ